MNDIIFSPIGVERRNIWDRVITLILVIAIVLVLSLIGCRFFLKEYVVDGSSMQPTFYGKDIVFVAVKENPKKGDVVIVNRKNNDPVIKRLIAVGGDTVQIISGVVYVNGIKLEEPYVKYLKIDNYPLTDVPDGKVFVLGDNRADSYDSRGFGMLDLSDVVGPVPKWVIKNKDKKWYKTFVKIYNLDHLRALFGLN